jgi:L-fucose isomerase-like protein
MCLSRFTFNFGSLYDSMGDVNIPIILFAATPELIMLDANLAASLRGNGAKITFAISEAQVLEILKSMASPRILEGKKALLFGKRFDGFSVPSRNLTEDIVYNRTGVKVQFRPLEELAELLKGVDEASAIGEAERWKKEAKEIVRTSDQAIIDACRLYVLLRSLIQKEGLSAVSMDCLSFTMGRGMGSSNVQLPIPCIAFARLRDEGITAACELDVCGLLSSMLFEVVSRKPTFMANVMSVDLRNSSFVFSHCVSPLKLDGINAPPMRYRLHDYHNMGRGVVPEVEFPINKEVLTGAFSKDLKSFTLWPGRILSQVQETERTTPSRGAGLNACANTIDIKIKDAGRFLQGIASIHHVMITGDYMKAIEDALTAMNVSIIGPSDFAAPEQRRG